MMMIIFYKGSRKKNQKQISTFTRFSRGKKSCTVSHTHTSFYHHLKHNLYNYFILSYNKYLFFRDTIDRRRQRRIFFFWEAGDVDLGEFESAADISTKGFPFFTLCVDDRDLERVLSSVEALPLICSACSIGLMRSFFFLILAFNAWQVKFAQFGWDSRRNGHIWCHAVAYIFDVVVTADWSLTI